MEKAIELKMRLDVPTIETTQMIDGFEVEDLIRTGFEMPDDYAGDFIIGYNDLINYTKNIIGLTMESMIRTHKELKTKQ